LDEQRQRKHLTGAEFSSALFNFSEETLQMVRDGSISIVPISGKLLTSSWQILRQRHIYAADALQIASCRETGCDLFLTGDRRLLEAARIEGLDGLDPGRDEKKIAKV
jgi:predicted nucleic acid-binding protein